MTTSTWRWVTLKVTDDYPPAAGPPWKGGQPNNGAGGGEDCVLMEGDGQCDEVTSQSDPQN